MNGIRRTPWALLLAAVVVISACATHPPAEYAYLTSYEVIGDRTVKYLYLPGERSRAGSGYLDQALAMEICDLRRDENGEIDEFNCRRTRVLLTEEYQ